MSLNVALAVAVDVEAANDPTILDGVLPDPCVNDPTFPLDVPRKADVYRQHAPGGDFSHGTEANSSARASGKG
jgi:hypothetical protein